MMWFLGILWTCICFLCGLGWDLITFIFREFVVWGFVEYPLQSCCCGVFLLFALYGAFEFVAGIFSIFSIIFEGIFSLFR